MSANEENEAVEESETEATQSETNQAEAKQPTDQPDATQSETGQSEAAQQETEQSEVTREETKQKAADEKFCSSCGATIKKQAEVCPECGVRQEQASDNPEKDPGIAALLSGLMGGWAGQIYNGQIARGIVILVVQLVNVGLMFVLIGFITWPLVWILGTYDAYNQAKKINAGEVQV